MGVRSQLSWMRHGAQRTEATISSFGAELRDLQLKVEALTTVVARIDATLAALDERDAASTDALRRQLRACTDDLGDRLGALSERLGS